MSVLAMTSRQRWKSQGQGQMQAILGVLVVRLVPWKHEIPATEPSSKTFPRSFGISIGTTRRAIKAVVVVPTTQTKIGIARVVTITRNYGGMLVIPLLAVMKPTQPATGPKTITTTRTAIIPASVGRK